MQLELLNKGSLEDSFIISIKADDLKKQAAVGSGRALKFPQQTMIGKTVKVDILAPIGSAYLVPMPGQEQYQLHFPGGHHCEVILSEDGTATKTVAPPPAESKDAATAAREAKDYLEAHKVPQVMQAMLKSCITDRPKEPFNYMASHLLRGYGKADEAVAMEATALPPPPLPDPALKGEGVEEEEPQYKKAQDSSGDAEGSSGDAASKEKSAEENSSKEAADGDVDQFRLQAKEALIKAADNGTLHEAVEKALSKMAPPEARSQAQDDGSLEAAVIVKKDVMEVKNTELAELDNFRLETKHALIKAVDNGTLEAVIKKAQEELANNRPTQEELRMKAKDLFQEATNDGRLDKALTEVLQTKKEIPPEASNEAPAEAPKEEAPAEAPKKEAPAEAPKEEAPAEAPK
eukprot:CAMPEP_0197622630 /NCGR_PEP_ID=MMETSP1338-20131121/2853_1 /TAXON_ID=43686 ORGANISM="Pelagodinium beii, Strain RCC1491" /NCGR_SAMPLE_ID=MMETSP1338 /ASSEMBLY_ACC=CAM_ASM_000754 /LENGTH=404 /DNA_ID=CAMNT_0043192375 /DNA_START=72 /DNA_END=1283 /DNA_ORIENTATION=-